MLRAQAPKTETTSRVRARGSGGGEGVKLGTARPDHLLILFLKT